MTAWAILTANSTAPVGSDAWAHLNAQQAGGGSVIIDNYDVVFEAMQINVEIDQAPITVVAESDIIVSIDTQEIIVEVC